MVQHLPWNVHRLGSSPSVQKRSDNTARIRMGFPCLYLPGSHFWFQSSPPYGSLSQLFKEPHWWHALLVDCRRLKWHEYKYTVKRNRDKSNREEGDWDKKRGEDNETSWVFLAADQEVSYSTRIHAGLPKDFRASKLGSTSTDTIIFSKSRRAKSNSNSSRQARV